MADVNERNRGMSPAQTPASAMPAQDIDIQHMDLDQLMDVVRKEVKRREPTTPKGAGGASSRGIQADPNSNVSPAAPDDSGAAPVVHGASPLLLSTDEIMRRVRAEVRRRRGEVDTMGASDPPGEANKRGGMADADDKRAGLPSRARAVAPLSLKPEYSLHELLQFSDAEFVDTVYRAILRRPADRASRFHYLSALRNGLASKTEVLGLIRFSEEGRRRGVHIDGLLLRFKLQRWRHVPVLGRCLGFALAVFRLPRLSTRLQTVEGNAARNNQALERFVDLNNESIAARLAAQESTLGRLREDFDVAIARLGQDAVTKNEKTDAVLNALRQTLSQREPVISGLGQRLDDVLTQIHALDESFRVQRDEYGHHHRDVVNHLGAHDTAIKSLTVEGQRVHHGALEIQRQLIALLDRSMAPAPAQARGPAASHSGDKVLAPQYVAFEDAFRGERDDIKQRVAPYVDTLQTAGLTPDSGLVLDLGCGRGEWLEVLAENGYTCRGVDLNSAMVADSGASGFDVVEGDAVGYLHDLPDASVAAITAMHIVEHIPHNTLIRLLDQAWRVLIPGGVLILETPNPENLTVGACLFYLDPTHRNPIPPALLQWTVKERGFDDAAIERLTAHRGSPSMTHVPDDVPAAAQINQIIDWFTAAPDYAIVAKKQADETGDDGESTTNA